MYTKESVTLSDKRFDKIVEGISRSYPNSCVVWIDEIQNDTLLARYIAQKEELKIMYPKLKELELYHGTKNKCIDSIARDGFKSEYNVTSAYGKGTYFATNAAYSSNYMRPTYTDEITYMFLCDVLVGDVIKSTGEIPKGVARVDNTKTTNIYVIPDDCSIYPRYIIAFYKNAK